MKIGCHYWVKGWAEMCNGINSDGVGWCADPGDWIPSDSKEVSEESLSFFAECVVKHNRDDMAKQYATYLLTRTHPDTKLGNLIMSKLQGDN